MEIIGYKCLDKDLTNRYKKILEVGKTYTANGSVSFGNGGHGYHFCKNLEDTLRYFDGLNKEISICLVRGTGNIVEYEDDYNGYYDIYSSENIEILKELSREETVLYGLNLNELKVCRFIQGFKLNDDEIEMFKEKFNCNNTVLNYIEYYQFRNKEAFKKKNYVYKLK